MIPLSTLLSHTLIAWTIELDNEFEARMPHTTTVGMKAGKGINGPWLVSFAMYVHCMRHLPPEGITMGELERRSRVLGPVLGLTRWGYVTVTEAPREGKRKPDPQAAIVRPTAAGVGAQNYWRPLPDEIDDRWRTRFGAKSVTALHDALVAAASKFDLHLPDFLPVLHYGAGMMNLLPDDERLPDRYRARPSAGGDPPARQQEPDAATLPLYALLSKVLLAFALDYEREADVSLALGANLVRVLNDSGVHVAELPRLTGISKDAVTNSLNLRKRGHLVVETVPGKRAKQARLTAQGQAAQDEYHERVQDVEEQWSKRFGVAVVRDLRSALEPIVVSDRLSESPLADGLVAPPDCWRNDVKTPDTLPHYPMVLHRGGYPDGA